MRRLGFLTRASLLWRETDTDFALVHPMVRTGIQGKAVTMPRAAVRSVSTRAVKTVSAAA